MLTKKNIDKMLEMPDDRLGSMIRLTLAAAGADTSNLKLDETAIRRIRAAGNVLLTKKINKPMKFVNLWVVH